MPTEKEITEFVNDLAELAVPWLQDNFDDAPYDVARDILDATLHTLEEKLTNLAMKKDPSPAERIASLLHGPVEEPRTRVTDLLADILHYCSESSLDFEYILNTARNHFDVEQGEDTSEK